jgi:uncharacterized protein (DUF58 family)
VLSSWGESIMQREELLQKIKKIEIASSILAKEIFSGRYRSYFKGNGMEFSDIRLYAPGDDVKKIDWKVTARQRKTYVKEFTEEREICIYILVDLSGSNQFSAKLDLIYQLVGSLTLSAHKNGDKVGIILFTSKIEKFIPPKKGRNHAMTILDILLNHRPTDKKTSIRTALEFLNSIMKKRGIVFLISDFWDEGYEKILSVINSKHDLIPIKISDKKYEILPKGAIFTMEDSESGERIILENYQHDISVEGKTTNNILKINTDDNFIVTLSNYFNRRRRRIKR